MDGEEQPVVEGGVLPCVQRSWSVAILPGTVCCRVPGCTEPLPHGCTARSAALSHLAWHARTEELPAHLRTCRCQASGCAWHRKRHRGCDGPITLALFPQHAGRIWHLADTCTGCLSAIPQAARVPETAPSHPQQPPRRDASSEAAPMQAPRLSKRQGAAPQPDRSAVTTALSYLAAVLANTGPQTRLLALACTLQADPAGHAVLPTGLRRSLRLPSTQESIADLTQTHWMRLTSDCDNDRPLRNAPLAVAISDFAVTGPPITLSRRARAAMRHWCWRVLTHQQIRQAPAEARLAALVVAASAERVTRTATIDPAAFARTCAVPLPCADRLLSMLTDTGWTRSWSHGLNGQMSITVSDAAILPYLTTPTDPAVSPALPSVDGGNG